MERKLFQTHQLDKETFYRLRPPGNRHHNLPYQCEFFQKEVKRQSEVASGGRGLLPRFHAPNGKSTFSSILCEVLRLGNVPWTSSSGNLTNSEVWPIPSSPWARKSLSQFIFQPVEPFKQFSSNKALLSYNMDFIYLILLPWNFSDALPHFSVPDKRSPCLNIPHSLRFRTLNER